MTMVEDPPVTLPLTDLPIVVFPDPLDGPDIHVVERARNLLTDPRKFCKGTLGRDRTGKACMPLDAERVCAMGALYIYGLPAKVNSYGGVESLRSWGLYTAQMLGYFSHKLYGKGSIVEVNDDVGQQAVLHVMDTYLAWRETSPLGMFPSDMRDMHLHVPPGDIIPF